MSTKRKDDEMAEYLETVQRGHAMLERLPQAQRIEFMRWWKDNPGANGLDWPGWKTNGN